MRQLVLICAVGWVAFAVAIFGAFSFFTGQFDTGVVCLVGALLLVWWGERALRSLDG